MKLLTRDEFRESVFARDKHKCVICGSEAQDAHHILERRLFNNGGYYLSNGASLCGECHLKAEQTILSVEEIREACGIQKFILPEHMYSDIVYDKWGNIILPNGQRLKGDLFDDVSVQKVLSGVLTSFTSYVKYPRTYHVPWSGNMTEDDRMLKDMKHFEGKHVIITEKMDGENTSMYTDYYHARSVNSDSHISQSWARNFHSQVCYDIPAGWRVCGENMFAKHSIEYTELETYFYGFSVWNDTNTCLSWKETKEWFELLGIKSVPVLYDGIYDERIAIKIAETLNTNISEGYVIRIADSFSYKDFRNSVAKFVRKGHVQTVQHWKYGQPITKNKLK